MYNELYELWKNEFESSQLCKTSPDFYARIAEYLRRLKDESRMLDKRTAKATLLRNEIRNVRRMLRDLMQTRYRKMIRLSMSGEKTLPEVMTDEDKKVYTELSNLAEAYKSFSADLLSGRSATTKSEQRQNRIALRFLKDVPEIIGADMKIYGPFKAEDVGSLPTENAKILIRQGLVEKVEVS